MDGETALRHHSNECRVSGWLSLVPEHRGSWPSSPLPFSSPGLGSLVVSRNKYQ